MTAPAAGASELESRLAPSLAEGSSLAAAALGYAHAAVDAGCAFVLFRFLAAGGRAEEVVAAWIVAYDVLAFAGQVPLALLVERCRGCRGSAVAGIAGVLASLAIAPLGPVAASLVAGLGNALFHLGAGGHVLERSRGRATEVGIFIGPGAIGLALGILAGRGAAVSPWAFAAALALALPLAFSCCAPRRGQAGDAAGGRREPALDGVPSLASMPLASLDGLWPTATLVLLVIVLRSVIGDGLAIPWRPDPGVALELAIAAALGKMLGGVAADRLGWRLSSLVALVAAAAVLAPSAGFVRLPRAVVFGHDAPWVAIAAMFLVQTTTGVSFAALAGAVPGRPALAFALGSAAVLAGVVPGWLGLEATLASGALPAGCALSAMMLAVALGAPPGKVIRGAVREGIEASGRA